MASEIHYTSAPRGVFPGTHGYSTVACSAQMLRPFVERIEGLSVYRNVYPPHDPRAHLNPISYAHVRLSIGGVRRHVVSRIVASGLDYSDRTNKYAHHIILEDFELPPGGPAWLMGRPGFLSTTWDGHVGLLPDSRPVPQGDRAPRVCDHWARITGDPGWAGVLAESFLADPKRVVFLVHEAGTNLLPLFEESLALLPPNSRWDATFSTYFTGLPQGVTCTWRGVIRNSPEAAQAASMKQALVLDLGHPLGQASGGRLVSLARTGPISAPPPLVSSETRPSQSFPHTEDWASSPTLPSKPYDIITGPAPLPSAVPPPLMGQVTVEPRRRKLVPILAVVALFLALGGSAAYFLPTGKLLKLGRGTLSTAKTKDVASPKDNTAEKEYPKSAQESKAANLSDSQTKVKMTPLPPDIEISPRRRSIDVGKNEDLLPFVTATQKAGESRLATNDQRAHKSNKLADGKEQRDLHSGSSKIAADGESPREKIETIVRKPVSLPSVNSDADETMTVILNETIPKMRYRLRLIKVDNSPFNEVSANKNTIDIYSLNKKIASFHLENIDDKLKVSFRWEKASQDASPKCISAIRSCVLAIDPSDPKSQPGTSYRIALRERVDLPLPSCAVSLLNIDNNVFLHTDKKDYWGKQGRPFSSSLRIKWCETNDKLITPQPYATPNGEWLFSISASQNVYLKLEARIQDENDFIVFTISPDIKSAIDQAERVTNRLPKRANESAQKILLDEQKYNELKDQMEKFYAHLGLSSTKNIEYLEKHASLKNRYKNICNSIEEFSRTELLKPFSGEQDTDANRKRLDEIKNIMNEMMKKLDVIEEIINLRTKKNKGLTLFNAILTIDVGDEAVEVARIKSFEDDERKNAAKKPGEGKVKP